MKSVLTIPFLLLLATPALADWAQPELGHKLTALREPVPAPGFELRDMDEETHSLADMKGKVILLNFWATWCPPCRREMPSMERLHRKLGEEALEVVAINQMEDVDQVFAYTGQIEVDPTFLMLFDTTSEVSHAYGVNGLPTSYLIDKKGMVRYRAIGGREFDHPEVEALIRKLINE